MNRRSFALGFGLSCISFRSFADIETREIHLDGTRLRVWHDRGRLQAQFSAPTDGWLAVGFNNDQGLEATRFVIGAMRQRGFYAEEHIAVGPGHPTVQSLGFEAAAEGVAGYVSGSHSTMLFSLPHVFSDTSNPVLLPGTSTYLMLAWSHHIDFDHHSAWRRHLSVTL